MAADESRDSDGAAEPGDKSGTESRRRRAGRPSGACDAMAAGTGRAPGSIAEFDPGRCRADIPMAAAPGTGPAAGRQDGSGRARTAATGQGGQGGDEDQRASAGMDSATGSDTRGRARRRARRRSSRRRRPYRGRVERPPPGPPPAPLRTPTLHARAGRPEFCGVRPEPAPPPRGAVRPPGLLAERRGPASRSAKRAARRGRRGTLGPGPVAGARPAKAACRSTPWRRAAFMLCRHRAAETLMLQIECKPLETNCSL